MKNLPGILCVLSLVLFVLISAVLLPVQKTYSVLGDSYSSFSGYVTPASNPCYYSEAPAYPNDVCDVRKTWWWMWAKENGYVLQKNNSYSGATVCNTGYSELDFSDRSFVTRMKNIGNPDVLFIFGGTNDARAGAPLGEYKYSGWTKADLYQFRPAFACMLDYLKREHPKMRIVNICNCGLSGDYNASMAAICKHYGVECLLLENIDKQHEHPSIVGMRQIVDQINAFMN